MARTWWSITVELIEGPGGRFWPRPGRDFAAAPSHTFADLADAIDTAFARWDRAHLNEFRLADGTRIGIPDPDGDDDDLLDESKTTLSRLGPGERFLYVFDFGDGWHHFCTVGDTTIDPPDEHGIKPARPLPYWGWGSLPDQYGRRWADDDGGDGPMAPDPQCRDLPPFFPWWGDGAAGIRA
jgi:hypothetical protein